MRRDPSGMLPLAVFLGVVAGLAARANAQFVVTEFYDAPAANPAAGPDVDLAAPGVQITIRSAVEHINTLPPGSYSVSIPAGMFLLSAVGHGEDGARTGDIDIRNGVVITGAGLGATFIDGSVLGDRVFDVRLPVQAELRLLGVYGGTAVPGAAGVESGGGVRAVAGSTLRLHETEFSGNSAAGGTPARGGAIDAQGDLIVTGFNSIVYNSATGIGGAIYLVGRGEIADSHFLRNHSDRDGGAIRTAATSPGFRVTNTSFYENTSDGSGGAMNLRGPADLIGCVFERSDAIAVGGAIGINATVGIDRCVFRGNHSASGGGAINVAGLGDATIRDTLIEANAADTSGGGLINSSVCAVLHSTVSGNIALGSAAAELGGGGIYNFGQLTVVNSTISHNAAPAGLGGAILNLTGGAAHLAHATLFANDASRGQIIHNGTPSGGASMDMTHTVVAHFPGGGSGLPYVEGASLPLLSLGYNLDADGSGGLAGPGDLSGTVVAPIDPLLTPLLPGAGVTHVHRLLPGTPLLDAGDTAFSVDPAGNQITDDQRHVQRPVRRPDIGAVEEFCAADLAPPYLVLNFFDIAAYLNLYNNLDPAADLAAPFGVLNIFDISAYISLYNAGCP